MPVIIHCLNFFSSIQVWAIVQPDWNWSEQSSNQIEIDLSNHPTRLKLIWAIIQPDWNWSEQSSNQIEIDLNSLPPGKFFSFFVVCWSFSKYTFSKNSIRNTISVKQHGSRSGPTFVGSGLGPKCKQILPTDNTIRQKYCICDYSGICDYSEYSKYCHIRNYLSIFYITNLYIPLKLQHSHHPTSLVLLLTPYPSRGQNINIQHRMLHYPA